MLKGVYFFFKNEVLNKQHRNNSVNMGACKYGTSMGQ